MKPKFKVGELVKLYYETGPILMRICEVEPVHGWSYSEPRYFVTLLSHEKCCWCYLESALHPVSPEDVATALAREG